MRALLFLVFIFSFYLNINAQQASTDDNHARTYWKGYERIDINFRGNDARLIVPKKALPDNPWLWRARFPDWHTEADSILLAEGFHVAYINTDNKFGSPSAVAIWDEFYFHLLERFDLQEKVALAGVSRGGLFIYNWAKENPNKVSCIYAEAPVCDFKSWPGGFGNGKGSPKDWGILKQEYGFESDEDAKAYNNNPIENLEVLAKAKVPLLHMIGLKDEIVPVKENTLLLINQYIELGGSATVVPCTSGEQKLYGHHFDIETPRLVADFIKYHSLKNRVLNSSDYHSMRSGLRNSGIKFKKEKKGKVAFLGGSITYNPGWRDSVSNYLSNKFPETSFEFIEAGIPSMGTTPAAFRLERDVLSHGKIDLLFEEAAVNDDSNGRSKVEQKRAMEGIIRHLRESNPAMDIVMMHFVDPGKMEEYRHKKEPSVIANHNEVARQYNIPTINLAKEVSDRIDNKEFNWESDFINLHPSPFGQGIYAHSIIQFLDQAYKSQRESISAYPLPEKLDPKCYDKGVLIDISEAKLGKSWHIDPSWTAKDKHGVRANYHQVPMLISEKEGGKTILKFTGKSIGIAVAAGPDAGIIEYRIDKGEWLSLNLFTKWSNQLHLPWYYTLDSNLSNDNHSIEIRLAQRISNSSITQACRIRYFYVNRL